MKLCLTGGGTAGHVTPHFALVPEIKARGWEIFYVGGDGIERSLVTAEGIEFHAVATGKLRRYFSLKNFVDVFKVALGCLQAFRLLLKKRPDAVFSKGGFVAVPVAVAAWVLRIPVVSHESDLTPGLANKLIAPFARRIVYTFPDTQKLLPASAIMTGTPIRAELFEGDRDTGLKLCGFDPTERVPTYLFMGGSQGAQKINECLLSILPELVRSARVIHLAGTGKLGSFVSPRYKAFEFVRSDLKHLFAAADFVVSRGGANSIFELLALRKPMLLIPLEVGSRGDQVVNAASFEKNGWAAVLRERDLSAASMTAGLAQLAKDGDGMRRKQAAHDGRVAAARVLDVIQDAVKPTTAS